MFIQEQFRRSAKKVGMNRETNYIRLVALYVYELGYRHILVSYNWRWVRTTVSLYNELVIRSLVSADELQRFASSKALQLIVNK